MTAADTPAAPMTTARIEVVTMVDFFMSNFFRLDYFQDTPGGICNDYVETMSFL